LLKIEFKYSDFKPIPGVNAVPGESFEVEIRYTFRLK
jgi:hypothetical protein